MLAGSERRLPCGERRRCPGLPPRIACSSPVLGSRFLVVTREMGAAGKDGIKLCRAPWINTSSVLQLLLPPPALLSRAPILLIANVLLPCCLPTDLTCGLLRAADHGHAVSRACPSRVLLLLARRCDHLLACLSVICAGVHQPMRACRLFVCLVMSAPAKRPPCT